jgi:hypothetical protein
MSEQSRREFLAASSAAGLATILPQSAWSEESSASSDWQKSLEKYLGQLARTDGGYGWDDQQRSHLAPTFAVIGCYHLLGKKPPNADILAEFVRTHHPAALKKLEQEHRIYTYQQVQSLAWLGASAADQQKELLRWDKPLEYLRQYEQHGYPVFFQEVSAIVCRKLLGLSISDVPVAYVSYLDARRRANGSFNNTPAADGSDGNIPGGACGRSTAWAALPKRRTKPSNGCGDVSWKMADSRISRGQNSAALTTRPTRGPPCARWRCSALSLPIARAA